MLCYEIVSRVHELKKPHPSDSDEYTQHTFHDKIRNFPKTALNICFLESSEEFPRDSETTSNQPE